MKSLLLLLAVTLTASAQTEKPLTSFPYSGLTMTISTRYHQTDDQDRRTWIAPKIPVALSSEDYFANRDPVMDAVLETIRTRPR